MTYVDTEVSLERAGQADDIWCGVIPAVEIAQIIHCTGRLRAAQKATLDSVPNWFEMDYDMERIQWRKVHDSRGRVERYELWAKERG